MARALIVLAFALSLCAGTLLPGCTLWKNALDDPEGPEAGLLTNPAGQEGRRELDSELCWESIGGKSAEGVEEAYDECMRDKGWSDPQ